MGRKNMGLRPDDGRTLGGHRLAETTIAIPPERDAIAKIQERRTYSGWEAVEEAGGEGLLRPKIRHAELSPTYQCPEDCGGCPDRKSLHLNDPPESRIVYDAWFGIADRLKRLGVEYFMLIGGTIDREKVTPALMRHILGMGDGADFGWFTDGIMLQHPKTGVATPLATRLIQEGGMLNGTTHVSADYLVPEGVAEDGPILDSSIRWENVHGGSRWFKSAFGERLARRLIDANARRVVLNTAVSAANIEEVLPVYNYAVALADYARESGKDTVVLWTMSPWVWRPHLARGDDPRNYDAQTFLRGEHGGALEELSKYIAQDTERRIHEGGSRVAGNSRGFIEGLPEFAITQDVPYNFGSSELAVQPDGTVRIDPVFTSPWALSVAKNPYGYRDRDIDHNPFDAYARGPLWSNLIQTTRKEGVSWK